MLSLGAARSGNRGPSSNVPVAKRPSNEKSRRAFGANDMVNVAISWTNYASTTTAASIIIVQTPDAWGPEDLNATLCRPMPLSIKKKDTCPQTSPQSKKEAARHSVRLVRKGCM